MVYKNQQNIVPKWSGGWENPLLASLGRFQIIASVLTPVTLAAWWVKGTGGIFLPCIAHFPLSNSPFPPLFLQWDNWKQWLFAEGKVVSTWVRLFLWGLQRSRKISSVTKEGSEGHCQGRNRRIPIKGRITLPASKPPGLSSCKISQQ